MNGVLGHFFVLSIVKAELGGGQPELMRLIWDETLPQCSIDRSTLHTAVHHATSEQAATPWVKERDGKIKQKDMMRFDCHFLVCLSAFF